MEANLRIFSCIAVICYFIILAHFLKKGNLMLKYSLLWILAGIVLALFVIFPDLLRTVSEIVGIETPSNGLFAICIMFIIFILMALTMIVSFQKKRLRQLSQTIALLENDIEKIKKQKVENT